MPFQPQLIFFKIAKKTEFSQSENYLSATSLVVQWLRLQAFTAGGVGSITGQGTMIPHPLPPTSHQKKENSLNKKKKKLSDVT